LTLSRGLEKFSSDAVPRPQRAKPQGVRLATKLGDGLSGLALKEVP